MSVDVDIVILGGGAAGLWLLDELMRDGYSAVLLEAGALGAGQTVASQGIIHGGLKYSLRGMVDESARAIREMPEVWRSCLAGTGKPNLGQTRLRAEFCWFWNTQTLRSRLGALGGKAALRARPKMVDPNERPAALKDIDGGVYRVDEPIIDPVSFLEVLSGYHQNRQLKIEAHQGLVFTQAENGTVQSVRIKNVGDATGTANSWLDVRPEWVVLTAGAGNAALREQLQLRAQEMQRRPLNMVVVRGGQHELPEINGHCADGSRTRVTVTTARDANARTVWQIGGQVAEDGVKMTQEQLINHTRNELREVIPGVDLAHAQWLTYKVDRAEGSTPGWRRPEGATVLKEQNVLTAWPTKLALVPAMARQVASMLDGPRVALSDSTNSFASWPRPNIATPPWETDEGWTQNF